MVSRKAETKNATVLAHAKEVTELAKLVAKYSEKDQDDEVILITRLLEEELRISLNCFLDDL